MIFDEDASVLLLDFGVSVTDGSTTSTGILDLPSQIYETVEFGDNTSNFQVLSTEYVLTVKTSDFGTKKYNDTLTVDNVNYKVRNAKTIDDGLFTLITLSKS